VLKREETGDQGTGYTDRGHELRRFGTAYSLWRFREAVSGRSSQRSSIRSIGGHVQGDPAMQAETAVAGKFSAAMGTTHRSSLAHPLIGMLTKDNSTQIVSTITL
jgi:hypothetical protein